MSKRNIIIGAIVVAVVVVVVVLVVVLPRQSPEAPARVTVGSKGFTEQLIVGELMAQLLEDRGFDVELLDGLST